MQHLLTLMEAKADIARGFHKGNKEAHARIWRNAKTDIKRLGACKSIAEWKKGLGRSKKVYPAKGCSELEHEKL